MRQQTRFLSVAFASAVLATALAGELDAADLVKVQLSSGRVLIGEVDDRTDDTALWLRFRYTSLVLSGSYAWARIESVEIGQERMSSEEFRQMADELATPTSEPVRAERVEPAQNAIVLPRRHRRVNEAARIAALSVSARLANWDRDAEMDGLEVCVVPFNLEGELVRATGHLKITLLAQNYRPLRDPDAFPKLGQWTLRVDAGDFQDGCAVYRIPFWRIDPQGDFSLRPLGLLQVQLNAYGQGTFAAETPVLLRTRNPVGEALRKRG